MQRLERPLIIQMAHKFMEKTVYFLKYKVKFIAAKTKSTLLTTTNS